MQFESPRPPPRGLELFYFFVLLLSCSMLVIVKRLMRATALRSRNMGCSGGRCSLNKQSSSKSGVTKGLSVLTPAQTKLVTELNKLGLSTAKNLQPKMAGNPEEMFNPYASAARSGFNSAMPTLAERFTSMKNGPQHDSFMNSLNAGGVGLDTDLAAQKAQYGMNMTDQQQNFLKLLLGQGLTRQFEPIYKQRGQNAWSQLGGGLMSAAPHFMGFGG